MPILGNLLIALAKVLSMLINMYTFVIVGAIIISWVRPDPYNPIVRFLYGATQPVFSKLRRVLPRFFYSSGIDFTPMLVVITLVFIDTFISGSLMDIGIKLKYGNQP
ncbi:YggT family protein [bacterium]|nr:YggT family protein [bacterium]